MVPHCCVWCACSCAALKLQGPLAINECYYQVSFACMMTYDDVCVPWLLSSNPLLYLYAQTCRSSHLSEAEKRLADAYLPSHNWHVQVELQTARTPQSQYSAGTWGLMESVRCACVCACACALCVCVSMCLYSMLILLGSSLRVQNSDVQWKCEADMDGSYKLGQVEVQCEGYEYREDPYILAGSCGLTYSVDFTDEGRYSQGSQNQYSRYSQSGYKHSSGTSWGSSLFFILGLFACLYYCVTRCNRSGQG